MNNADAHYSFCDLFCKSQCNLQHYVSLKAGGGISDLQ